MKNIGKQIRKRLKKLDEMLDQGSRFERKYKKYKADFLEADEKLKSIQGLLLFHKNNGELNEGQMKQLLEEIYLILDPEENIRAKAESTPA